ncbi:MAG: glutaredoxin 3 [Polyangiaceae bacterium]|nr:glutaredoxin 3 [Polyangiaceae bacterium]
MAADVFVYTTQYCGFCERARALLRGKNVTFTEIDVEDRPDLRRWLEHRSKQRTVPQVFVNGVPLGGYTDIAALDRSGKLDPLLAADPSAADPKLQT